MKKLLILAVCMAGALSASGQGSLIFSNPAAPAVAAPIFDSDGTTRIGGDNIQVRLVLGGTIQDFQTSVRTGGGVGFFTGGVQVTTVPAGGTATAVVQAWDADQGDGTYEGSLFRGDSDPWELTVAGDPSNVTVPPQGLVGMPMSGVSLQVIPEPSTIALAVLGGVALLFRRRK